MISDQQMLGTANQILREVQEEFPEHSDALEGVKFRIWGMSACAGRAFHHLKLIKLSRNYYRDGANFDADFRDTVLHEIAHLLTPWHRHDKVWKATAKKIGCNGERCHSLALAKGYRRKRSRYYVATCGCEGMEHKLSARTHGRHGLTGDVGYYCEKCMQFLKLKDEVLE